MSKPRCPGTSRQSGEPCKLGAGAGTDHRGVGLCKYHGGSSPGGKRQAQMIAATRACESLGIVIETDGITALTNRLWEVEGDLFFYREQVKLLGADVTEIEEGGGEFAASRTVPSVLVVLYHQAQERSAKIAVEMVKAGIEEKRLHLDQVRAAEIFRCVAAALAVMGLASRLEEFRHAFAAALRGGPVTLHAG